MEAVQVEGVKEEAGGWGKLELPIYASIDGNGTVLPTGQALQGEYLVYPSVWSSACCV